MNPTPPAMSEQPKCHQCGNPATCIGSYDGSPIAPSCDDCCGHGNEDGWCDPVATQPPPQPAAEESKCCRAKELGYTCMLTLGHRGWHCATCVTNGPVVYAWPPLDWLRPSPVDEGGVITDRAKKVAAEIVAHYDSGFIYELGRSGLETAKWLISKRIQEAIDAAPLATAGVSDGDLLDWLEAVLFSGSVGNGIAIFALKRLPEYGGEKMYALQDLGDSDGSAMGEELTGTKPTLREAIRATMTAANQQGQTEG